MTRYAIQGTVGSFHHAALNKFLGSDHEVDVKQLICSESFYELVKALDQSSPDAPVIGVMAIENSSVGSLLYNYNLIQQKQLRILGETYMHIEQNLLANKNVKLQDITEVHSHPIALQQCMSFLSEHKWKIVESDDTAMSAEFIRNNHSKHIACIAGRLAAQMYGLDILVPEVNDFKHNYTRFLILTTQQMLSDPIPDKANKASIQFYVEEKHGALASVLHQIAKCDINLSKLQSFAMTDTYFRYYFHADLDFESIDDFHKAIALITPLTENLTVYGIYQKGI